MIWLKIGLQGEAFALRAWFQWDLLQKFGGKGTNGDLLGFPIVTEPINASENVNLSRNSYDECVAQIISDCDSAFKYLPIAHRDYLQAPGDLAYAGVASGADRALHQQLSAVLRRASPSRSKRSGAGWKRAATRCGHSPRAFPAPSTRRRASSAFPRCRPGPIRSSRSPCRGRRASRAWSSASTWTSTTPIIPFLLGPAARRWARRAGRPLVFTYHTRYEKYAHYVPLTRPLVEAAAVRLSTRFASRADAVVAPSMLVREHLRRARRDDADQRGADRRGPDELPARRPCCGAPARSASAWRTVWSSTWAVWTGRRAWTACCWPSTASPAPWRRRDCGWSGRARRAKRSGDWPSACPTAIGSTSPACARTRGWRRGIRRPISSCSPPRRRRRAWCSPRRRRAVCRPSP